MNELKPKISVLMPNWNSGSYIHECIKSVKEQSYKNFEVIICDSGSTDESRSALVDFKNEDKRVKFFDVPKLGIYPGWNECLKHAKGDWIAIATTDDSWSRDFLMKCIELSEKDNEARHVCVALNIIDTESKVYLERWQKLPQVDVMFSFAKNKPFSTSFTEALITAFISSPCVSINGSIFKRNLFKDLGKFSESCGNSADRFWYAQVFLTAKTLFCKEFLANWRRHDSQATARQKSWSELIFLHDIEKKILKDVLGEIKCDESIKTMISQFHGLPYLVLAFANSEKKDTNRTLYMLKALLVEPVSTMELIFYRLMRRSPFIAYREKRLKKILRKL